MSDAVPPLPPAADYTREPWHSLLRIARAAGEAILEVYRQPQVAFVAKPDATPLTAADTAAHALIAAELAALYPELALVSEEDPDSQPARLPQGRYWLIDPLDGTREFLARNGEFTVNIAQIHDGVAVLGVVYAPVPDLLYWGGPGLGACRRMADTTEAIAADCRRDPRLPKRVLASRSHRDAATEAFIERCGDVERISAGSSLKFCRLAEGAADLYPRLGPTCEWDTAAAQAVLEGAGGAVVDLRGQPLRYGKADVSNPFFIATADPTAVPGLIG